MSGQMNSSTFSEAAHPVLNSSRSVSDTLASSAKQLLNAYIYEFLIKNMLPQTAKCFVSEADVPSVPGNLTYSSTRTSPVLATGDKDDAGTPQPSLVNQLFEDHNIPTLAVSMGSPKGFLYEWWHVFWDIFQASHDRKASPAAAQYRQMQSFKQTQFEMLRMENAHSMANLTSMVQPQQQTPLLAQGPMPILADPAVPMQQFPRMPQQQQVQPLDSQQRYMMLMMMKQKQAQQAQAQQTLALQQQAQNSQSGHPLMQKLNQQQGFQQSQHLRQLQRQLLTLLQQLTQLSLMLQGEQPMNPLGMSGNMQQQQMFIQPQQDQQNTIQQQAQLQMNNLRQHAVASQQQQQQQQQPMQGMGPNGAMIGNNTGNSENSVMNARVMNSLEALQSPLFPQQQVGQGLVNMSSNSNINGAGMNGVANGLSHMTQLMLPGNNSNALQDYQMQLILMEKQNKMRLEMTRLNGSIDGSSQITQMSAASPQQIKSSPIPSPRLSSKPSPNSIAHGSNRKIVKWSRKQSISSTGASPPTTSGTEGPGSTNNGRSTGAAPKKEFTTPLTPAAESEVIKKKRKGSSIYVSNKKAVKAPPKKEKPTTKFKKTTFKGDVELLEGEKKFEPSDSAKMPPPGELFYQNHNDKMVNPDFIGANGNPDGNFFGTGSNLSIDDVDFDFSMFLDDGDVVLNDGLTGFNWTNPIEGGD